MRRYFKVAEHVFGIGLPDGDPLWGSLGQYEPFLTDSRGDLLFELDLVEDLGDPEKGETLYDEPSVPGEAEIRLYRSGSGYLFETSPGPGVPVCARILAGGDFRKASLCISASSPRARLFSLNNAAMLLYAFASAPLRTLEMHASMVGNSGKAFLFLAPSGTGKSTHSRMWLENVPGTELMNDDNPVVRIWPDGRAVAYGSPWSGKTPCYRNVEAPVGAFVKISRCTENRIARLDVFESYAELYSSSSGLKTDPAMADALHETLEAAATTVPCYVMDCLPDAAAALVCSKELLKWT